MRSLIKIEKLKLKGKNINLYVIFTAMIPFIIGVSIYLLLKKVGYEGESLGVIVSTSANIFIMMLFPIFTTYITFIIGREEHLDGGWKLMLTYPIEKKFGYISKLLIVLINQIKVLILFLGIYILISINQGAVLGDVFDIMLKGIIGLIGYLPFLIIVFYMSMKFTTAALPMASGIMITILNSVIINSETYYKFVPTTYGLRLFLGESSIENLYMIIGSFIIFILLTYISLRELEKGSVI